MREGTEVVTVDMGEAEDMSDAKFVGDALETAYPGYLWMVSSSRGVLSIKNGMLSQFVNYGMILDKSHSATNLKDLAITAGGELLERCGLPRGKWTGVFPEKMEGADARQLRWHTPETRAEANRLALAELRKKYDRGHLEFK